MEINKQKNTNDGNSQSQSGATLLDDLDADQEAFESTTTFGAVDPTDAQETQWKPTNFHELANFYQDFYNNIRMQQNRNINERLVKKYYHTWELEICGISKNITDADMLNGFIFNANKNEEYTRNKLNNLFSKFNFLSVNNDFMTDDGFIISMIHRWYKFADEETCSWRSDNNLQNPSIKEMRGKLCRACATYFIKKYREIKVSKKRKYKSS